MFELLPTILEKLVDLVVRRSDVRREDASAARLFELYVAMLDICDNAKIIKAVLEANVVGEREPRHVADAVQNQAVTVNRFADLLWEMSAHLKIFDQETHFEIQEVIGGKYLVLRCFFDYFVKTEGSTLRLIRLKGRQRDMELALRTLEREVGSEAGIGRSHEYLTEYIFKLADPDNLKMLIMAVEDDIKKLEDCTQSLAKFIRDNCDFADMFPATMGRRRYTLGVGNYH